MQHAEIIAITAAITACNLDQYVCVFATLTSNHIWHADSLTLSKKGKVPPYSLPSVGPGADPGVQAVSPQVTLSHPPRGRLPVLSTGPTVTFPAGTKLYCLVTVAHACEQLAQGCYLEADRPRFEPATFCITSECSTVMPHRTHYLGQV